MPCIAPIVVVAMGSTLWLMLVMLSGGTFVRGRVVLPWKMIVGSVLIRYFIVAFGLASARL